MLRARRLQKTLFQGIHKIQNHKNQDMRLIFIPRPAPTGSGNRGYRLRFRQEPGGVSRGYWILPGSVSNFFDTLGRHEYRTALYTVLFYVDGLRGSEVTAQTVCCHMMSAIMVGRGDGDQVAAFQQVKVRAPSIKDQFSCLVKDGGEQHIQHVKADAVLLCQRFNHICVIVAPAREKGAFFRQGKSEGSRILKQQLSLLCLFREGHSLQLIFQRNRNRL